MKHREQWLREVGKRQENSLPLNIAANEGQFLGRLIRGGQKLTPMQRVGTLIVAMPAVALGVLGTSFGISDVISPESSWSLRIGTVFGVVFCVVVGYVGLCVCRNALRSQ